VTARVDESEFAELEAMRDLFQAAGVRNATARELGGALCMAVPATPKSRMLNRVLGIGLREPASEELLDETARFYAGVGVPYAIQVSPRAQPPNLAELLRSRGFTDGYAWAIFRRSTGRFEAATDLRIAEIGREHADAFALVGREAYGFPRETDEVWRLVPGRPRWHCFLAFDGDAPAATGALFVQGTYGWLGFAGTRPEFRRRGAQSALLAVRITRAGELGLSVLCTETGVAEEGRPSNSYRNLERAGFRVDHVRPAFWSPED
jgi:GNAT superfamily N-acetyltransferase